jgi:hypothetical protein
VTGGTGDDIIRLTREGSTVNFAKGDGKDTILSRDDLSTPAGTRNMIFPFSLR